MDQPFPQDLGFRVSQQICRKDVLSAQDDREWQATALSQSLTGEGPVAGAEKKKLNLEEERKEVEVKPFDYKPIPRPKRSEN
ncbi:hypothetical protein CY35_13G034500 [Sphagnum magellanicum]|nr:hypothetical protein CY35_13G034500 [Sphagnum magellanicum]KAH9542924.1 hypothetical protein CY35_13G034500 [Sphagnum magellanicum]